MKRRLLKTLSGAFGAVLFAAMHPAAGSAVEQEGGSGNSPAIVDAGWQDGPYTAFTGDLGVYNELHTDADFRLDSTVSLTGHFGIGYRWGPVRLEGEFFAAGHYFNDLDSGPLSPFPAADYEGLVGIYGGIANLYLELPLSGRVRPFAGVGAGAGMATVNIDRKVCDYLCDNNYENYYDGWGAAGVWQGMAGVSIRNEKTGSELVVGYRYFATTPIDFASTDGIRFTQEGIRSQAIMFGYLYRFGAEDDN